MQDKNASSSLRSTPKRLARAKVKPSAASEKANGKGAGKGSKNSAAAKGSSADNRQSKAKQGEDRKQLLIRIGIGAFAVIMALSMMLPSLSYIFGSNTQDEAAEQAAQSEQATEDETATEAEDSSEEESSDTSETSGMDSVDAAYQPQVDSLKASYAEDKKDLVTLLGLGSVYMEWGNEASMYAYDDEAAEHVSDLYANAIKYFDKYLKINDSTAVRVNRALCQVYDGKSDEGIAALEQISEESPDYAPVWLNLGRIYEVLGSTEKAKDAYNKAIEVDPDNEYGAKTYANTRLASMAQSEGVELTQDDSTKADTTNDSGAAALENALGNK